MLLIVQARRSFRALKGLVRLQGVVRGQNVKRQTVNAMKYMQLLVRVQSQIQSRRIQMLESQARRQVQYKNDKEIESTFGKWTLSQAVSFLYQFFLLHFYIVLKGQRENLFENLQLRKRHSSTMLLEKPTYAKTQKLLLILNPELI